MKSTLEYDNKQLYESTLEYDNNRNQGEKIIKYTPKVGHEFR